MGCEYRCEIDYYESASSIKEQLDNVREIIKALRANALKAAANDNIDSYKLDDGQTVIWTTYRSSEQIQAGLRAWRQEEQLLLNQLYGHRTRYQRRVC